MPKSDASVRIDAYIAGLPDWSRRICEDLRSVVNRAAPKLEETIKWNSPCFCGRGIVCGFMAFKNHVTIDFWLGQLMDDGYGLFEAGEDHKSCGRCVKFRVGERVPKTKLATYVKQAAKLDAAGEIPPGKRRGGAGKRAVKVVIPEELASALELEKHATGKAFFDSLPPSARRDYCDWISGAKREETRERRLTRTLEQLAAGRRWYA